MKSKYCLIKGFLKYKRFDFEIFDTPANIHAQVAYNKAFKDVLEFIDSYERGETSVEYRHTLLEANEEK